MGGESAATHGDDDFQLVAVGQGGFGELAAGHDLAVALHGDALAHQVELLHQLGNAERFLECVGNAVDRKLQHLQQPAEIQ